MTSRNRWAWSFLVHAIVLLSGVTASAQPTFSKAFAPGTIGPGSSSRLTFTIENNDGTPVTDLAFTDTLPAGVTLATPVIAASNCGGTLTAADGGTVITLVDGVLAGSTACTIAVSVTSATVGTHSNTSGDLTSSSGNSGPASADIVVDAGRPGFSKNFSPDTVPFGSRSTLTFTVDNTANAAAATSLTFSDSLPLGMTIADPSNASTTCGTAPVVPTFTATPGSSNVSFSYFGSGVFPAVAAGATCVVVLDVVGSAAGALENLSGVASATVGFSALTLGVATATLNAAANELVLIKEFTDDPIAPGGTAQLQFTILNRDRDFAATDITFMDDLDAALSGMVAVGLPLANPCGAGSVLSGTSLLTLTGGNLAQEGSCTFAVTVQVPAGATPGIYPNITNAVQGTIDGPVVGNQASDDLFVFAAPLLEKTFLDDPVAAGSSTRLEFTITNTSATSAATSIAFMDELTTFLPTPLSLTLPPGGFCGAGSAITVAPMGVGGQGISMTGGNLAAGASCTFEVTIDLPAGMATGTYTNVSQDITAVVDGETLTGSPATADFDIVGGPQLSKRFIGDPVAPGETVTLQFTLANSSIEVPTTATAITFTDNLDAALVGMVALGLPMNDICGAGSQISGTSNLTFTGGTLASGESCQFNVTLQVPAGAAPGFKTNTTSNVSSTVSGLAVTSLPASDVFLVTGLTMTKEFIDDPALPGGTTTLRFTIDNAVGADDAADIAFTDNLNNTLTGLAAVGLPANDVCGIGSSISGTTNLTFTGGNLTGGTSCVFDVTLDVPVGAASNTYINITQNFSATIDGNSVALQNAVDSLIVAGDVLGLTKTFLTNPVGPGATVGLEFEITNLSLSGTATGITFTDDLDAALSGLQAIALPADGFCGPGSQITGAGLLTLTGAELAPGASCSFTVTLQVPAVPAATSAVNVTSQVTGTINALGVTGDPATDTLGILNLDFTKSFDGPTTAGGTAVLTFDIENLVADPVAALAFTDDLDATLGGLVATGLPLIDVCGPGSSLSGTSVITLTGGNLGANGSCSFNVTVQVPGATAPGVYPNTTSDLSDGGLPVASPATADLIIDPSPPLFNKLFAPNPATTGAAVTLTFTVDNTASVLAATGMDFTDNLPAGMVVANPSNASTTCTGGTLTAVSGSGAITYTGGAASAGASCTVVAYVTVASDGVFVNTTGDLTSSAGNSGSATDTLTATPLPVVGKAFDPDTVALGQATTLTITIDNTASVVAATNLSFTDNLPVGMEVANPSNASTTCTGGTLTAVAGSGTITYAGGTVAAGTSCTVVVDVLSNTPGDNVNTVILSSSLGSSGAGSGTLVVAPAIVIPIPTLSGWALIMLALLMVGVALRRIGVY